MNEQQECCDTPRGFVGGTCDYCGGTVQPEAPEIKLTGTPETDACAKGIDQDNFEGSWRDDFEAFAWVPADFARQLERQRDELREKIADWENAAEHVKSDHQDELHCGCVPVLRKLLTDAKNERDELLEALARTLNATVLNHRNDRWHLDAEYVIKKIKPAL